MASKKDNQRPVTERRVFNLTNCEVRAAEGENPAVFSGYAAVFNELSVNLGGFRERIQPGCFRNAVDEGQDVRFLINHDANLILGRSTAGTLKLAEDELGLRVECSLPNTSYANDLIESMRRGDIDQMSFGFRTVSEEWKEKDASSGLPIRELVRADLFDVSAVAYPAYPDTSAEIRSLIAEQTPELLERAEKAAAELETRDSDPAEAEAKAKLDAIESPIDAPEAADLEAERGVIVHQYFGERAKPVGMIELPEGMDEEQAAEMIRTWEELRAGKILSQKNQDAIAAATELLSGVLQAAADAGGDAELGADVLLDAVGNPPAVNSALPDLKAFRESLEALEERSWSYQDDWKVWSLTQMIEGASIFLLYADDQNDDDAEEDAPLVVAMKEILTQLTAALSQVVAAGGRSDEPEGEQREDEPAAEERDDEEVGRFDRERRRLALVERETELLV